MAVATELEVMGAAERLTRPTPPTRLKLPVELVVRGSTAGPSRAPPV